MIEIGALTYATVLGFVVGSFLNVCIYRLPKNISIISPGSSCPYCHHSIRWYDNIPLVSFLALKGRCRDCGGRISIRYPLVECCGGIGVIWAVTCFGWSAYAAMAYALFCAGVVVTFVDMEYQIIPDEITLSGIVLGVVFSALYPKWQSAAVWKDGVIGAVLGLLVGGGFLYLAGTVGEWIFKKEAMGGGDVKLLAAIGAFCGWKGVIVTIFCGSLVGSVVGIASRLFRGQERIPFGPYLVLGALVHLTWGEAIIRWYTSTILGLTF